MNDQANQEASEATISGKTQNTKEVTFHFKTDKETQIKRESVALNIPVPTIDEVIAIIQEGGKGLDLLQDAIFNVIYEQARSIVNETPDVSKDNFDETLVSWETIANLPAAQRRGAGIAKEIWESFAQDYIEVMVQKAGKSLEKAKLAADLLVKKFQPVKTNKQVVTVLRDYLGVWFTNSTNAEEYANVFEFLDNKAKSLLEADEAALLNNL